MICLQDHGYVESVLNSVGNHIWHFSERGKTLLKTCYKLIKEQPVLQIRDAPLDELSRYELLSLLEQKGWQMQIAPSGQKVDPFLPSSSQALIWYLKKGADVTSIPLAYFQLLLRAAEFDFPIPHLCSASKYKQILATGRCEVVVPAKRKQIFQIE